MVFFSFQVENVHWKCMCAAHWCIIKINKNKNRINLRNHEFVRKKQNGGWKVSDADWFYYYNFFMIRVDFCMIPVDPSPILFYFYYFFIRSELIRPGLAVRVDPVRLLYLPRIKCLFVQCRKYHTSWWNGAAELHTSVNLVCGTTSAELHNSVDLLCA